MLFSDLNIFPFSEREKKVIQTNLTRFLVIPRYLNQLGGASNATTNMEHTWYRFTVTEGGSGDALAGALDRFARFFVAPLFNKVNANLLVSRFFFLPLSIFH